MWLVFATSTEPGQSTHMCSLTRHYTIGWPTSRSCLYIPKMIMYSSKNRRWNIPFKKLGRLRVNNIGDTKWKNNAVHSLVGLCRYRLITFCSGWEMVKHFKITIVINNKYRTFHTFYWKIHVLYLQPFSYHDLLL